MTEKNNSRSEYFFQPEDRRRRRGKRRHSVSFFGLIVKVVLALLIICLVCTLWSLRDELADTTAESESETAAAEGYSGQPRQDMEDWPNFSVELLDVNPYSRPGIALKQVNGIVIHYTANPGSTAEQNRNYFENLAINHTTKASSHFIIGIQGEIIQCIPCSEMAYASNDRNSDTLAIECCIPDESGSFSDATYDSLVELTAWLVCRYNLTTDDVIRHYDITGKNCPKYFVEHLDAWESFLSDVDDYIAEYS